MASSKKDQKPKPAIQFKWWHTLVSLAFGVMLTLIGLVFLVAFAQVNVLSCTRLEPSQYSCVLETKLLGVAPLSSTPLAGLRGARLAQEMSESKYEDSRGRTRTRQTPVYWVALITDAGEVALDSGKSSWVGSKQQTVERINGFINSRATGSLQVYSDWTSLFFIWAPLLFLAPGLFLLIGTAKEIGAKFIVLRQTLTTLHQSALSKRRP